MDTKKQDTKQVVGEFVSASNALIAIVDNVIATGTPKQVKGALSLKAELNRSLDRLTYLSPKYGIL